MRNMSMEMTKVRWSRRTDLMQSRCRGTAAVLPRLPLLTNPPFLLHLDPTQPKLRYCRLAAWDNRGMLSRRDNIQQAGIMSEMIDETFEMMDDENEELDDEAEAEVDKVLFDITNGKLGEPTGKVGNLPVSGGGLSVCIQLEEHRN